MTRPTIDLGPRLKSLRESRNLSLDQVADYLGLEPHVLSGVEKGYRKLTAAQAEALASRLSKLVAVPGAARVPLPELGINVPKQGIDELEITHFEGDDCPGGHRARVPTPEQTNG